MSTGDVAGQDRVTVVPNGGWDERILICRCGTLVDVFIIVTERYAIIVDTLIGPATAAQLLAIARPYLDERRTLLVINTHADWDHCLGNQLFAGASATFPAPIIASRACAARFAAGAVGSRLARLREAEPARFAAVEPIAPNITFDQRLLIDGGDLTLELFLTPGHTTDHLAIHLPEIDTLLVGDAAERPFPFAHSAASLPQLRTTLDQLAALNARTILACHAPPEHEPTLLHDNKAYFDELEAHCQRALAAGRLDLSASDSALAACIGWRFEEVVGDDLAALSNRTMYQQGHHQHIHVMLEWLLQKNN